MLASIAKRVARYLGLMPAAPARAAQLGLEPMPTGPDVPTSSEPPTTPARHSDRRSRPRPSPLAALRGPRVPRLPRIGIAIASRIAAESARRRPKTGVVAPKRRHTPRHVWLETRPPAMARGARAGIAALLAAPGEDVLSAAA
jgi:hypothetical protein